MSLRVDCGGILRIVPVVDGDRNEARLFLNTRQEQPMNKDDESNFSYDAATTPAVTRTKRRYKKYSIYSA